MGANLMFNPGASRLRLCSLADPFAVYKCAATRGLSLFRLAVKQYSAGGEQVQRGNRGE